MKTWFITGSSRGFGRIWAEAALKRGDKVAATARNIDDLKELSDTYGDQVVTMALDVNDKKAVDEAVKQAHETLGTLDIVVNNAGYGQFGAIEEISEQEARDQIETNLFGALWVTQAALPIMREQGSGHILQVSSVGGINAFPGIGMYHASKWGLEGFSQSLSQEVAGFGINVTLIEPAGFSTDWGGSSAKRADPIDVYEFLREARKEQQKNNVAGDPDATADVILELVDMEEPPLRLFLGTTPNPMTHTEYEKRLALWDKFKHLSDKAQG